MIKKITVTLLIVLCMALSLSGCSAVMAAKGKAATDISLLRTGDDQDMVQAKIGHAPTYSGIKDGYYYEAYKVYKEQKAGFGRAIGHGVMGVLTLGSWELIGTPAELMGGEGVTFVLIKYDNNKLVDIQSMNGVPKWIKEYTENNKKK